jgi:fumarate reductase subunit C
MEVRLYLLQRATAAVLAPLVILHLALIIWAVRGGLTAAEILGRTEGSLFWRLFYGLFVVMAAVHGTIGLRNILAETLPRQGRAVDVVVGLFGLVMLILGFRAVGAVT